MTKIFLIRHAEAEGNLYRRAHGHYDGQIIGRGFAQIERLKERFLHEKIDAVYSSDLSRTCLTASAIYEPHGLLLKTTERLREVNMGMWEDMAWGGIEYNYPEMSYNFGGDPAKWSVEGSEEFHCVQTRMKDCILEIAKRHKGENVAAFSHGFAIRALVCKVLGIESCDIQKVPYFDNTAVSLLLYDNDELTIDYKGDNSHLTNENSTFANQNWWRGEREATHENLRFIPLNTKRDCALFECFRQVTGTKYNADMEYTAMLGEEAVGLLGLSIDNENSARIDYIYVKPELNGKNFGIQLIGQAVSISRKLGFERLRVDISDKHPAVGFFEKLGFIKIDEINRQSVMEKNIRI